MTNITTDWRGKLHKISAHIDYDRLMKGNVALVVDENKLMDFIATIQADTIKACADIVKGRVVRNLDPVVNDLLRDIVRDINKQIK